MGESYQGVYEIRTQQYGIGHFERALVTLSLIASQDSEINATLWISPEIASLKGERIAEFTQRGAYLAQAIWSYEFQVSLPLCELTLDEIVANPTLGSDDDARIAIAVAILIAWSKLASAHNLVSEDALSDFLERIEVQVDIEGRTFLVF